MGFGPKPVWPTQGSLHCDLMARAFNVQTDLSGNPLPFFPESVSKCIAGETMCLHNSLGFFSNPYVFSPMCLIPRIFKYLNSLKLPYTLVVPDVFPRRFWWPLLLSACSSSCLLASKGASEILLNPLPPKDAFLGDGSIFWDLWAFRISNN